jgi:hypothetical protein
MCLLVRDHYTEAYEHHFHQLREDITKDKMPGDHDLLFAKINTGKPSIQPLKESFYQLIILLKILNV